MASPSEFSYHFNGKDAKKFFYVHEKVAMKTNTEEWKADNLVAYLEKEAFESYFDNLLVDSAHCEEPRSFQKVNTALLWNFFTKKIEAEVRKQ